MDINAVKKIIKRYTSCLFAAVLLLGGWMYLLSSCEREEYIAGSDPVIPALPAGEPVTVNFTVGEHNFGNNGMTVRSTAPLPPEDRNPPPDSPKGEEYCLLGNETSVLISPPSGESEKASLHLSATLQEKSPSVSLRAAAPLAPGRKARVVAYQIVPITPFQNDTVQLAYADYEVDAGLNLIPYGTPPMTVPSGSVYFVAYSFNDTITMPAFSETILSIGPRDLLWGDTLINVSLGNRNVHIILDHLFSKIEVIAETLLSPSSVIHTIYGARYNHTFPELTVRNGDLTQGVTDTVHIDWQNSSSGQKIWTSAEHYVFTNGASPVVVIDSVSLDGIIYKRNPSPPWTVAYSTSLTSGREYALNVFFTLPLLSVSPSSWNPTSSAQSTAVTVTTNLGTWYAASDEPSWCTVSPTTGTNGQNFTVYVDANPTFQPRTAIITVTAGLATPVYVTVTQDGLDVITIPGPGVPLSPTYVGAFWRYTERGERIININAGTNAANLGAWTASVAWYDTKWNPAGGDGIVLAAGGSSDGGITGNAATENPGNAESYPVAGNLTSVSGSVASGGNIVFRIGLQQTFAAYNANTNPARYGVIILSYGNPVKMQKIFIRQGEGDDYAPGQNSGARWSPYNLSTVGNRVTYPTQAGYFYQWGHSNNTTPNYATPMPYHPINPVTGSVPGWLLDSSGIGQYAQFTLGSVCPAGYALPTGLHDASNEMGILVSANRVEGYYADGWFDRRTLYTATYGLSGMANSAVSVYPANPADPRNDNVAYRGLLFFDQNTNESIFLPGAGFRNGYGVYGNLTQIGHTFYWTRTPQTGTPFGAWCLSYRNGSSLEHAGLYKTVGMSLRCVRN